MCLQHVDYALILLGSFPPSLCNLPDYMACSMKNMIHCVFLHVSLDKTCNPAFNPACNPVCNPAFKSAHRTKLPS